MAVAVPEPPFAPQYARQHGCAWFTPAAPGQGPRDLRKTGGWAAVGGEPAFAFSSFQELAKDVLWWTNLSKPELWSLGQFTRFKDGGFLGPEWILLMNEQGQGLNMEAWPDGVRRNSELMARLGEWLSAWTTQYQPERPWAWGQGPLADVLSERWGMAQGAPEAPQPVLQAAYAEEILQEVPSNALVGRRRVWFALPRLPHVRQLWPQRYPQGEWQLLQENQWSDTLNGRQQWVEEQSLPLLVRVDHLQWRHGQEEAGQLWWGQRGRRFAGAMMEATWLTGEEARRLSLYATYDVLDAYRGDGWTTEPLPPGWTLGEEDALAVHASMPGLLAWAGWQAAASPTRDPTRRHKNQVTARALWWRAAERQRCFEAAWSLHQAGYAVMAHGRGQVTIALDPTLPTLDLAGAVRHAGLILPRVLAQALPMLPGADPTDPVQVAHFLRRQGDPELLADLDRLVAPWPGPRNEIKAVLGMAAQHLQQLRERPDMPEGWRDWWNEQLQEQARVSVERINRSRRKN